MPQHKAIIGLICFSVLFFSGIASAQEETDWKEEIISDREQLQGQKQTIKENASAAREEEQRLRQDIQKALQAGDTETADKLLEQLKATHRENIQQKREDMGSLKELRQELKQDTKSAREEMGPPPRPPKPPLPAEQQAADRLEDWRDRREDIPDRREDIRDRREDFRDRREDIRERKEDKRDGPGKQQVPMSKQKELKDNQGLGEQKGVRDHGAGVGAGKGQGGVRRAPARGPKPR